MGQNLFFSLPKYIRAFVTNYLRIIINPSFITLKVFKEKENNQILYFLLFELLVHENFHLLRRIIYCGKESILSLTQTNDKELKENQMTGEIVKRLISYFFKIFIILGAKRIFFQYGFM